MKGVRDANRRAAKDDAEADERLARVQGLAPAAAAIHRTAD
jgi:hypothetical protein